MRFCRLTESEPCFAVNLRSLPAKDFYEWVEYCNAPPGATTLSDLRAHNSFASPRALEPQDSLLKVEGRTFPYRFPPASVTLLTLDLA